MRRNGQPQEEIMQGTETTVSPAPENALDPRRWLALAVVLGAVAIDLIDATIVNVAIPSIQQDLAASAAAVQWMVAGYTLAFAVVLITGGRLGDAFGRKRLFLIGVAGFAVASAAAGLAPTPGALIAARVVQGALAALMVPQVLSMIQVMFSPEERPKAYGIYGAVAGLSTISGPIVGGLLVQADLFGLDWRPIFLINVPLGIATFVAASRLVPESRAERAVGFDFTGMALVTAALMLLLYPLVEGRELDWPTWTFVSIAASVPVLALFAWQQRRRERRGGSPLVSLGLFRQRAFTGGVLAALVFFSGIASFFLALTIALQAGLGFSPLHMGATALPWSIGIAAAAGASVQLAPRLGRRLTVTGSLAMAAGMGGVLFAVDHGGAELSSWALAPGLLVAGLGMGMVAPTLIDVALAGVRERDAGSASGVINTSLQLGGAIGVAVIGVIFFGLLPEGPELAADPATGFASTLRDVLWFEIGIYLLSAAAMMLLPERAATADTRASQVPPEPLVEAA
jgi:EmrB/QacA subfamily drug resistance transporter